MFCEFQDTLELKELIANQPNFFSLKENNFK